MKTYLMRFVRSWNLAGRIVEEVAMGNLSVVFGL